ncbi:MAG: hypothetical protein JEZ07_14200 [Phycisphaerae bacterium]|nr:hypothetical protein [Phycisphaerae bacterium]
MENQNSSKNIVSIALMIIFSLTVLCFLITGSLFAIQFNAPADSNPAFGNVIMFFAIMTGVLMLISGGWIVLVFLVHLARVEDANESMVSDLRRITSDQTRLEAILTSVNENIMLSESIKSIAFRRHDRQVLVEAIQQDINAGQWQSSTMLIDELEERFGQAQEAQKLRAELEKTMQSTHEEKINKAVDFVRSLCEIHDYSQAFDQENYLMEIYSDNPKVKELQDYVTSHRQNYKRDLLQQLRQASAENDFELGIEVLNLLDPYLTPTEAKALEESARDIFRARLHNMGVKFSLFVTEHSWDKALDLGQAIINEYPNSRMAQEVREKIVALKERVVEMQNDE